MFVEGAKNGNYRSVSIAHSLRGAFFLGGAAPAVAGAGCKSNVLARFSERICKPMRNAGAIYSFCL